MATNHQRIIRAGQVLDLYAREALWGKLEELPREELETAIGDLLCDLNHYADATGVDFLKAFEQSRDHHRYEARFQPHQEQPAF